LTVVYKVGVQSLGSNQTPYSQTNNYINTVTGYDFAVAFQSTSDIRLKENILPILDAVKKLQQINGVYFTWKETKENSIGVIAQDVEEVFPDLVIKSEVNGMKTVNYDGMIGVLVEAIKEQQKQIDELKREINHLKPEDK
jgi:hypothetical protein